MGCFGLFLQAKKVNTYFTELAERVEYGNYDQPPLPDLGHAVHDLPEAADRGTVLRVAVRVVAAALKVPDVILH